MKLANEISDYQNHHYRHHPYRDERHGISFQVRNQSC